MMSDEFNSLKLVEKMKIAPKAWLLDDSRKIFDSDFIILDYLEGKPLNETKYSLDNKLIKGIVNLCIKFHSMSLKGKLLKLPKDEGSYKDLLKTIHKKYVFLSKFVSNKEFLDIIKRSYVNLQKEVLTRKDVHPLVLSHGDPCEQNIIIHKGKLKFVCEHGHEFESNTYQVRKQNSWCPECHHKTSFKIGIMFEKIGLEIFGLVGYSGHGINSTKFSHVSTSA